MIPLKLTIEGIYSYQERQTIDFADLTSAGLFGIFGQVGSGKSSILEAISYALYGETERLNARDKRTYNMMNLKSNRSFVAFDFINYENQLFRTTREFKRNSKNFEEVRTPTAVFYKWQNNEWKPLEHTDAEKIVGLSYHNFKRTIIIPQGQFREFLELGGKERTTMMKEIFNLHRYDLQDRTSTLAKKNQSELDVLEGRLSGFGDVTTERIAELEKSASQQKEALERTQNDFKVTNEGFQQLKSVKVDFDVLHQKQAALDEKQKQKKGYDEKKVQVEKYEKIYQVFHQLLTDKEKNEQEVKAKKSEQEKLEKTRHDLKKQKELLVVSIEKLKPQFDALPAKKREENDLELIAQALGFTEEITILRERVGNGKKKVEEAEQKEQFIRNNLEKSELELKTLQQNRINSQILIEAGQWFNHRKSLEEKEKEKEAEIEEQRKKLKKVDETLISLKIQPSTFEEDFQKKSGELNDEKKRLEVTLNHHQVQQQLSAYSHELHDGEPCPLCGSPEHPHIAVIEDTTEQIKQISQQINQTEEQLKNLRMLETDVKILLNEKISAENLLATRQKELAKIVIKISNHKKLFNWNEFHPDNPDIFEEKKKASLLLEKEIDTITKSVSEANKNLRTEQENIKKYQSLLEKLKLDVKGKETQISQNISQLKELDFNDFAGEKKEEVSQKGENLRKENSGIEQTSNRLNKELNGLNPKLAGQESALAMLAKRVEELSAESREVEKQIEAALALQRLNTIEEANDILKLELDTPLIREEIEKFTIAFETLRNNVSELEKKLAGKSFDETTFKEVEDKLNRLTDELNTRTEKWNVINAEMKRLSKELKEKETLLQKQNQLQKRADNLKVMTNLFKGSGFVQYVSSVYLRQLCDHANIRFHRMTRNQLSLQLNDDDDFEVIDYLNGGKSRSVKTLSGGQSFQASLSMSLALAESVQSDAKADKNFFFIDEGFGTQDTESVNIVFDTLMQLQKENRIVGIISHVEELKERIPVALKITKDEERGSLIAFYE